MTSMTRADKAAASLGLVIVLPVAGNTVAGWVGSDLWRNVAFYALSLAIITVALTRRGALLSRGRYGGSFAARVGCVVLALASIAMTCFVSGHGADPLATYVVLPALWLSCSALFAQVTDSPMSTGQAALGLALGLTGVLAFLTGFWLLRASLDIPPWPLAVACVLLGVAVSTAAVSVIRPDDRMFPAYGVLAGAAFTVCGCLLMVEPLLGRGLALLVAGFGIAFGAWSLGSRYENDRVNVAAAGAGWLILTTATAWAAAGGRFGLSVAMGLTALGFSGVALARVMARAWPEPRIDAVRVAAAGCVAAGNFIVGLAYVGEQTWWGVGGLLSTAAILAVVAVSKEAAPLRAALLWRLRAALTY